MLACLNFRAAEVIRLGEGHGTGERWSLVAVLVR